MTSGKQISGKGTSANGAGGCSVTLRKTRKSKSLRIGTLSFAVTAEGDHGNLPLYVLLDAIARGFKRRTSAPDMILTAGRTVLSAPNARDILVASRGVPVLFEASSRKKRVSWILAHDNQRVPKSSVLRESQIVAYRAQEHEKPNLFRKLARVLSQGKGFVRIGDEATLVLLICGENNLLESCGTPGKKLLRRAAGVVSDTLNGRLLKETWIVLNPAHRPYQRGMTRGFTKVARLKGVGPTLRRITNGRLLKDGYREPVALLHCNNFNTSKLSRSLASRLFVGGRIQPPVENPYDGHSGEVEWRTCLFEIPL